MKSKIIALLIVGSTLVGGVQAHAATLDKASSAKKIHSVTHKWRPSRPTRPSTGGNSNITKPSTGGSSSESKPNDSTVTSDKFMAQVEQAIFNKVNQERAKAGVAPLTYNTTMEKYARIKSQDMGDNNYFDHKDLNGNLITTKMKADGVSYQAWGENIAYIGGITDPTQLANKFMTNWMNSSGHRKNILSTNFKSIGVGVYKVGNKVYATQEFYK